MLDYAFKRGIRNDAHLDPEWNSFEISSDYTQYAAFVRMVRFFHLISQTALSENTLKHLHYYYVWWRPLLKTGTDIYNPAWDQTEPKGRCISCKADWVETCRTLDSLMKLHNLQIK